MKRRKDIQIKITKADRNLKAFLGIIKKLIEKADEESLIPNINILVS